MTQIERSSIRGALIAATLALLAFPALTHAYITTDQVGVPATANTAIYTVTYKFGTGDESFYMPVGAVRDLPHGSQTSYAGYRFLTGDEEPTSIGTAAAFIFSDMNIVDGFYEIPPNTVGTFTLFAILTVPDTAPAAAYALHLNELPFYVGADREEREMNPSELDAYTSPRVHLNGTVAQNVTVTGIEVGVTGNGTVTSDTPGVTFTVGD